MVKTSRKSLWSVFPKQLPGDRKATGKSTLSWLLSSATASRSSRRCSFKAWEICIRLCSGWQGVGPGRWNRCLPFALAAATALYPHAVAKGERSSEHPRAAPCMLWPVLLSGRRALRPRGARHTSPHLCACPPSYQG